MEVFRLTRKKYAETLSGVGAALRGARWNSAGVELVYTSSSRALALAEVAVHLSVATLPSDFVMVTIEIPNDLPQSQILQHDLPIGWNAFPYSAATQKIGDQFVQTRGTALLKGPSAVVKGDFNYLINPMHPDFHRISITHIEEFPIDRRLFG